MRDELMFRGGKPPAGTNKDYRAMGHALLEGRPVVSVARQHGVTAARMYQVFTRRLIVAARRQRLQPGTVYRVAVEKGDMRYAVNRPEEHGTLKQYRRGCKCDLCRSANKAHAQKYSKGAK